MIVGVTHDSDGRAALRLAVSTKVAIGMPPQGDRNYPSKLDHFVFLRTERTAKGVEWEPDPELMKHYGSECRAFEMMLIDDDIDNVFPTSYAWWTATERKCSGDGTQATRRTPEHPTGQPWMPCGSQCPELASGLCKPSGDLRFVLANFPRLGSICRIHTSSYRSIRQIHSALEEIQTFTGGRLAGITAKLAVRPEQTSYFDRKEQRKKTTTIWALSLEVDGDDIRKLVAKLTGSARLFAETRKLLGWGDRTIEVVEDEGDQAPEITAEFYPPAGSGAKAAESVPGNSAGGEPVKPPAGREAERDLTAPWSQNGTKPKTQQPIMEPRRRGESSHAETKPPSVPQVADGSGSRSLPTTAVNAGQAGQAAGNDSHPQKTKLRGTVGPIEPDASGNIVRRTEKGLEYVAFTLTANGATFRLYCKQPELMAEITRLKGTEAVAVAQVVANGKQPCYILNGFAEG